MTNYPTRMFDNQIWFGSGSKVNADDIPETLIRFWLTNTTQEISGSKIFSDDLSMNSNKIIHLATPTNDYDAATKKYVDDNAVSGSSNDHSQLINLDADDHLQYYNAERLAGVVSGSNHPTSSTLDYVVKNGSYTNHGIQVDASGSRFYNLAITSGSLEMFNHKIIHLATPANDYDATTKKYVDQNFEVMKEPTGFPNRTDSSFNFRDNTRVFEIEKTGSNFDYYINGTKYTISGSSIKIPDTEGLHYIYFDTNEILHSTQTFSGDLFTEKAIVSILYWDATNNEAVGVGEERHGITMNGITHLYLHQTVGTRYETGLALNSFDADGTGDDATNAQFGYTSGIIWDEDIEHEISADTTPAQISIIYKLGAGGDWRKTTLSDYPLVHGADYAGTRAAYNQYTGGAWQLTEVGNNDFVLMHYFATNDQDYPIIGICGQATYGNLAAARAGAVTELNSIITSGLPTAEFKAIATVIFQTGNGYSNTPKSRVRTDDTGADWVDWRFSAGASSAGTQINDHSQLTGLDNDDHSQYYNAERLSGVVSGSHHPTSSTLDNVCDNGNTTDQLITVQGITSNSDINGGADLKVSGDLYVHYSGPEGTSSIFFYEGGYPTGASIVFNDTADAFIMNHSLRALEFKSLNNMYINYDGGDGDSHLYFYDNSSATGAYLQWDDNPGTFKFSHALDMSTNKITSVVDPVNPQDAVTLNHLVGVVSGSTAYDTLDDVCERGATTDVAITVATSGSTFSALTVYDDFHVGGDIIAAGDVHVKGNRIYVNEDAAAVCYLDFKNGTADIQFSTAGGVMAFHSNLFSFDHEVYFTEIDVAGEARCNSFRIDQTPTAGVPTPDKYITISCNGTSYKIGVEAV